jgi:hypothetical protein
MRSRRTPGRAEDRETLEEQLCRGLEDSFPASDPVSAVSTLISGRCKSLAGTEDHLRQIRDANEEALSLREAVFETVPEEALPRDPRGDASGWTFKTLEHDEHAFPHAIVATDAEGRSLVYVAQEFDGVLGQWTSGVSTSR